MSAYIIDEKDVRKQLISILGRKVLHWLGCSGSIRKILGAKQYFFQEVENKRKVAYSLYQREILSKKINIRVNI